MKLPFRPDPPQWPKLLGTAALTSLVTLFMARNFFPAEKKIRHRVTADYDIGDDVFVRTMGHLLGPPLVEGNKVTALENGEQIFPAMLEAIRSAERTITFENFRIRSRRRWRNGRARELRCISCRTQWGLTACTAARFTC